MRQVFGEDYDAPGSVLWKIEQKVEGIRGGKGEASGGRDFANRMYAAIPTGKGMGRKEEGVVDYNIDEEYYDEVLEYKRSASQD